jgi:hypothetical protein
VKLPTLRSDAQSLENSPRLFFYFWSTLTSFLNFIFLNKSWLVGFIVWLFTLFLYLCCKVSNIFRLREQELWTYGHFIIRSGYKITFKYKITSGFYSNIIDYEAFFGSFFCVVNLSLRYRKTISLTSSSTHTEENWAFT